MNARNRRVFLRVGSVLAAVVVDFVLFQRPFRQAETGAAVWLLKTLGARGVVQRGAIIEVLPAHREAFRALVAPSCSALASVLTVACLGLPASNTSRGRRSLAILVACGTVAAGNVLRIAASVGVGFVYGRSSLILFHDVAGSIFGLGYTLAGFLIMLHVLLPKNPGKAAFGTDAYGFETPERAGRPLPGFVVG